MCPKVHKTMFFHKCLLPTLKPSPDSYAVKTKTPLLKTVRVKRKADGTKKG